MCTTSFITGVSTGGGANFRVEVTSPTLRQICPVRDYLNGTYLSCCMIDVMTNTQPYNITIYLQFVNFHAYQKYSGVHTQLWQNLFVTKNNLSDTGHLPKVSTIGI